MIAILLIAATFSNALRGEFVYDDNFEIVKNPYIQHGEYFWTAMTSDVWAFKGQRDRAWSNYWRPVFVAWMAMNYQLFGLNPVGWHVTSIAGHAMVTLLVLAVLRRLGVGLAICAFVTWLFAIHPVQTETVAWASGIPNILMSGFALGCYLCYLIGREKRSIGWTAAVTGLYALALLSKEGAIALPLIVMATEWVLRSDQGESIGLRARHCTLRATPLLIVAAVFVLVRYLILGSMRTSVPGAASFAGVIATVPSVLVFYLRQIIFPYELGPVYGIRPVDSTNWNANNLIIPLMVIGVVAAAAIFALRRMGKSYRIGWAWFLFPIALALDIRVFLAEQIVHDRYLYMPLMGALLIVGCVLAKICDQIFSANTSRSNKSVVITASVCAVVLAVVTWRYNPVWGDDIALWQRGVAVDPDSAYAYAELGEQYRQAGRIDEAKRTLARALEINPNVTNANIAVGMIAVDEGRYDDAQRSFRRVLDRFPDYTLAIEQSAGAYQRQEHYDSAIALFDSSRKRLPYKHTIYTVNIAVLHKLAGRPDMAIEELESIRDELAASVDADVLKGWWFLGVLYAERNQTDKTVDALEQYLAATSGMTEPEVNERRKKAETVLQRLRQ